ncbi:MAG: DNA recombination protein RmuC [Syntrophothermus sp.]
MPEIIIASAAILVIISFLLFIFSRRGNNSQEISLLKNGLDNISRSIERLESSIKDEFARSRNEQNRENREQRGEMSSAVKNFGDSIAQRLTEIASLQKDQLDSFALILKNTTLSSEDKLEKIRSTVETRLEVLQAENSKKLEEMRATVDEKLQSTLEKRLGESFRMVSERLEQVHKGLGEMQSLAAGVGDLKKVLSNVKTRGVLGEYQLGSILEQILTPDQYAMNVKTNRSGNNLVEYAVKLPGREDRDRTVWLPLDAKFPTEDYQSLLSAYDAGDTLLIEEKSKALSARIKSCAKDIRDKYVNPPDTTDFAILFLPFEGLYAEVLRNPGLFETIQREYKVTITGPTTLAALLNSLQMGFKTLAIEQRSGEVWDLLGAVKTEFGNFGEVLSKTQKKLLEASTAIEKAGVRSRAIERKLRDVQMLPKDTAIDLLGSDFSTPLPLDEEEETLN